MMGMMGPPGPCMPQTRSAFSAALSTSFPSPDLPVKFTKVFYNQKNFIVGMGIYVAPINGTYVFSYHLTVSDRPLVVGLFHNFRPILISTDTRPLGTTSHTIVLALAKGDGVWLQVKDSVSNGMVTGAETSSVFSGYLLYPDRCEMGMLDIGMGGSIGTGRDNAPWQGNTNTGQNPFPTPFPPPTEDSPIDFSNPDDFKWIEEPTPTPAA